MNRRLVVRMTAPVVAISLLLLAVGVGAAWYVGSWQTTVSHELRVNASGIRAGEELEILIREARTRLDHFLITGDRKYLEQVFELRPESEHWLKEAERWGQTRDERQRMVRVRRGYERFWAELSRITAQVARDELPAEVRALIDATLVGEVLQPAHEYLDLTEEEVNTSIAKNQSLGDRLVYGLLLLGTCGSAAGLVAGFGLARGLRRSLVQLSVLIRDTAGHLEEDAEAITFSGRDLGELETVLRLIAERVGSIVRRLQEREREYLRAEQLAAVGQLAAGMAHELRNPLTSIKLLVQGGQPGASGDGAEAEPWIGATLSSRDLAVLEEEITRLERLVQSFLDFARPPKPDARVLDVRPLVEQTLTLVAGRGAAGTRIECVAGPGPLTAAVDPAQVRQVLLNLVLNALDATADGGTIDVTLAREGGRWVTIQVADRGCGLPAALGERIFEPFTTTKETGLGLGLSICRRIVAAHGGTLTAANRPDGGAVFTLRLPAAQGAGHVIC